MTDAGEKLRQRVNNCVLEIRGSTFTSSDRGIQEGLSNIIEKFCRTELERAAGIAEQPYSDEVGALGHHQPFAVGAKIAAAIRKLKE